MRKILMIMTLMFGLVSCGGDESSDSAASSSSSRDVNLTPAVSIDCNGESCLE